MRLKIVGINHNDVLGRECLLRWLQEAKALENSPPAFIAVEYDEVIFRQIKEQRRDLRSLAEETWPSTPPSVLKVIEESLVYEGDLHEKVFPNVETVWLDQDRIITDPTVISRYAQDRLNIYKSFAQEGQTVLREESLMHMSIAAWDRPPQPDGIDRDVKFARLIRERSLPDIAGWAIAIVGLNHASEAEGHMVRLLEDEGIECEVTELKNRHSEL